MLKKLFGIFALCMMMACGVYAQELNCKIQVLHEKITGVDAQVFTSLQKSLNDFMNTQKWTNDDFSNIEKIDCIILINITSRISGDANGFAGTINIQATRPVYNTSYTSPLINYVDRDLVFDYSQFTPIQFDDTHITGTNPMESNLTAVLGYYAYLILGLDYDSYSLLGGTPYFKKAQNIVNNAPEQGKAISGWQAVDGTRNRYWIIDQMLNSRFQDMRDYWYTYHRDGLDSMYAKPEAACKRILAGLYKLNDVNTENPSSALMQFFFNAKNNELISILAQTPRADRAKFITILSAIDVPDIQKLNELK